MTKEKIISPELEARVLRFLESYELYRQILGGNRRARAYFASEEDQKSLADDALLKTRMMAIRNFIMTLPDCREKMLLYYRYLFGHSVERCAELIKISRRSAFRLKKRALDFAGRKLERYFETMKNEVK